ncbi:hypothetical protein DV737_g1545, partial [Chaetothyriales sp. CBS 132003]
MQYKPAKPVKITAVYACARIDVARRAKTLKAGRMNPLNTCSRCLRAVGQVQRAASSGSPRLLSTSFGHQAAAQAQRRRDPSTGPSASSPPAKASKGPKTTNTATPSSATPSSATPSSAPQSSATQSSAAQSSAAQSSSREPSEGATSGSSPNADANDMPSTAMMQSHIRRSLTRPTPIDRAASLLRSTASSATETYIIYGLTLSFFQSGSAAVAYTIPESVRTEILTGKGPPKTANGEDIGVPAEESIGSVWFDGDSGFGLQPTFSTWSQVTFLHMYLLTVRLRAMSSAANFKLYQQYLLEHFSQAAEEKMMLLHTISARGIRNKYLKDLFVQWRGVLAAYDEGLIKGDAVLASAVWRNVFKGDEQVDWEKAARVVAWMRAVIAELAQVEDVKALGQPGVLGGPQGVWKRSWEKVAKSTTVVAANRNAIMQLLALLASLPLLLSLLSLSLAAEDLYKVLGLDKSASERDLKRAYRTLSKKYHPDKKSTGDSQKFLEVAEAYEALSDPTTRKIYDQYGHDGLASHKRGGQAGGQQHDPRGNDMDVRLNVPLKSFYTGADTDFTIERQQICEECEGSGSADGQVDRCGKCQGRGIVVQKHMLAPGIFQQVQGPCDACGGQGKVIKHRCKVCGGAKVVRRKVTLTASVERGMPRGGRLVFDGEADEHPDWVAGNLNVHVHELEPDLNNFHVDERADGNFFRRKDSDLYYTEVLSLREAWMGDWTRNVSHLDGHTVQLSRPRGHVVQPGTIDTIPGEGMPTWQEGHLHEHDHDIDEFGKLYVEYVVVLPDQMETSMEQDFHALWEKWRKKNGRDLQSELGRPWTGEVKESGKDEL